MLYKTTNNDTDDLVVIASYCIEAPSPPIQEPVSPPSPARPKPPKINWGVGESDSGPACPPMKLQKFQKQDGSCWAMYVPPSGAQISGECGISVAPFPASGC